MLLCDEPTSALDVSVQSQILNLLARLKRELGLTLVLISHNLAVVNHLADRVAVMYLGRIVEHGPTEEVFGSPRHPYTAALLASVLSPRPGMRLPEIRLGVEFPSAINPPSGCAFHPRCPRRDDVCAAIDPARCSQARADSAAIIRSNTRRCELKYFEPRRSSCRCKISHQGLGQDADHQSITRF